MGVLCPFAQPTHSYSQVLDVYPIQSWCLLNCPVICKPRRIVFTTYQLGWVVDFSDGHRSRHVIPNADFMPSRYPLLASEPSGRLHSFPPRHYRPQEGME
ncbi:unnamed protein product [Protopolystoma xenopodis]|uniref:Uncharacterized protein n=1 Tax=Protopolystoma xenopodis TaxID=117903 RepID=A0A448WEL4_9PLAT|nr:unnamed protein product [Protopolystoma xenopodis]